MYQKITQGFILYPVMFNEEIIRSGKIGQFLKKDLKYIICENKCEVTLGTKSLLIRVNAQI